MKTALRIVLLAILVLVLLVACDGLPTVTPTVSVLPSPTVSPLVMPELIVLGTPVTPLPEVPVLVTSEAVNRVIGEREPSLDIDLESLSMGGITEMTEMLAVAVFLSIVANRLIQALVVPLYDQFNWNKFSLQYVSWAFGSALAALSGVNLFVSYVPNPIVGLALTAVVCGGGANFISDLFGGE